MTELAAAPEQGPYGAGSAPPDEAAEATYSPGAALAARRMERHLSVPDVAQRLKFAPRQIEALEADDYGRLQGATFVRGMFRGYARMLDMDPAPLLAEFERRSLPASDSITPHNDAIPFPVGAKRSNRVYIALSGLMLLVALLVIYEWQFSGLSSLIGGDTETTAAVPAPKQETGVAAESPPAQAGGLVSDSAATTAASPVTPSAAPSVPASASPQDSVSTTAALAAAPVPGSAAKPPVLAPYAAEKPPTGGAQALKSSSSNAVVSNNLAAKVAQSDSSPEAAREKTAAPASGKLAQMSFHFDSDSWVRIKQANGKILMAQLNRGGTEQVVEGTPPFDVIIGNAPNVRLSYKSAPVDLRPYFKVDVARLTLE